MEPVTLPLPARLPAGPPAPLPPPAPLAMSEQGLTRFDRRRRHRLPGEPEARLARVFLFVATILLTAALVHQMWLVLSIGGLTGVEKAMLGLFVVNIAWIGFGAVSPLMGFMLGPEHAAPPDAPAPVARTALLMPTYNEDPARIVGAASAMLRAIDARGAGGSFDLFILSDTNRPDVWLAEQAVVDAARSNPAIAPRLHYRHRGRNLRRKAGNIADWVERWGAAYPFMLVLDADSLMEAGTVIELARRMEADDSLGILQTSPHLIGGETPLARVQQFASRVYGPVLTRGLRAWFGNAGNYWGHNAIIRTRAFAACGGLPELPGKPPFGGLILSHDFVEAAFVRRGGWAVRMADDLGGSYEHAPPNLIELASRDRRWCQGNLQHSRLLSTAGLHPLSRLHLFMGIMSYLSSPLWLLFLLAGMSLALHAYLVPPDYFLDRWSLFPDWPRIDPERAMALFGLCMLVLFAPKLLGTAAFLGERAARGLRLRSIFGLATEILLSALVAPIMMFVQTSSVAQILTGRDSGWNPQARDADRVPWGLLWRFHARHMYVGILLAVAAAAISWRLLAWMSPALIGLVLAVPISAFMGSARAGRVLTRLGLLVTPEERAPPVLARAAEDEAEALRATGAPPPQSLAELLADPPALARHIAWLDAPTTRPPGTPDANLASALLKLADGLGPDQLDARESFAVLASARTLSGLAANRFQRRR
jgi:membrane glycosyltransferase